MKSLFDKTELAGMRLKNRFIRSATYDGFADKNGHMTEKVYQIYEDLAKGGVGTIITGLTFVSDLESVYPGQEGIYDDTFINEYQKLTEMVHRYDAKIIMQLVSNGSQASVAANSGKVVWGPSAVEDLAYKITPQEMTKEDIAFVQRAFADAAVRAKKSGFDGIQMHVAHGYLLNRFLTPYYNRRTDEYGGNQENRSRMVLEIYEAIRDRVGPDYPVFIKINSEDFFEQGMTFSDCKYVCRRLAGLGIDGIEISGGNPASRPNEGFSRRVSTEQESYFKKYADEIAQETKIPVILVGGNRDVKGLTEVLNSTAIEYIALCRPFIRESDLVKRWSEDAAVPAKCISCSKCFTGTGTVCIFNAKIQSN
jgi:2,4-dienoyl-CoA reductase-like NADH-dependent reductase (Old Yellow Enzyme family)